LRLGFSHISRRRQVVWVLILRNLVGGFERFGLKTEALCALQTLATIYKKFHHSDNYSLNVCYGKAHWVFRHFRRYKECCKRARPFPSLFSVIIYKHHVVRHLKVATQPSLTQVVDEMLW